MIRVSYRTHKGRRFRVTRYKRESVQLLTEEVAGYRLDFAELRAWASVATNVRFDIELADGSWHYCFANVAPKHVKKWLDYYSQRY